MKPPSLDTLFTILGSLFLAFLTQHFTDIYKRKQELRAKQQQALEAREVTPSLLLEKQKADRDWAETMLEQMQKMIEHLSERLEEAETKADRADRRADECEERERHLRRRIHLIEEQIGALEPDVKPLGMDE